MLFLRLGQIAQAKPIKQTVKNQAVQVVNQRPAEFAGSKDFRSAAQLIRQRQKVLRMPGIGWVGRDILGVSRAKLG